MIGVGSEKKVCEEINNTTKKIAERKTGRLAFRRPALVSYRHVRGNSGLLFLSSPLLSARVSILYRSSPE